MSIKIPFGAYKTPVLKPDMCTCTSCEKTFKVADTIFDFDHHDGWEMPAYTIHECPECDDGGLIENYHFSFELDKIRKQDQLDERAVIAFSAAPVRHYKPRIKR